MSLMLHKSSHPVGTLLLAGGAVLLVGPALLISDLACARVALRELASVVIFDLLELRACMAFVILVIAVVAPTTPDNIALRLEAGVR